MTATKTGAAVDPGSREYDWVRTIAGTIVDEHGQVRYTDADAALEEGLTETWAQQNVDHAIYALGLDRTYPGLVNQGAVDAYPALQAASNKLVAGVATLSGLRETEVVRRMQATPVHERFEVVADLAIEQRMGGVVGAEKAAVRAELVKPLHEQFGKLMAIQDDETLDYTSKAQQGSVIGSLALTSFSQALLQAEHTASSARAAVAAGAVVGASRWCAVAGGPRAERTGTGRTGTRAGRAGAGRAGSGELAAVFGRRGKAGW